MKVDLSQEYKDNLYEKVLEKKKQRTKTRKVLLNTFLVFVSVVGIASYGFSKLSKGDYNNFFVSKTDNIEFNDEYEYFDDLGIKLEFINKDENSLTIGINIKYENIKDYWISIEDFEIEDLKKNIKIKKNINTFIEDVKYNSKSEITYIIVSEEINEEDFVTSVFKMNDIVMREKNKMNNNIKIVNVEWKKLISIE